MRVTAVTLRDFRNHERLEVTLGTGLGVVVGPNGVGKTNLLEGIYFGCTARSPRTPNDRELVRRGREVARVEIRTEDEGVGHLIEVGMSPGEPKVIRVDGAAVESLSTAPSRPLVSVFLPERLELVKGAPAPRRAHLDHLVAALWPASAATRAAYSRALAQRNALLGRIRTGAASGASLGPWDAQLSRHGAELMADRSRAVDLVTAPFMAKARELGLPEDAQVRYRPRSRASGAGGLEAELRERHAADIERGFTAHGPHRDDFQLLHGDDALRTYGSQGQQRVALLALLFAERDLLLAERGRSPLMLLDDVMSELDSTRRRFLAELLRSGGQALLTTTDLDHVPMAPGDDVSVVDLSADETVAAPIRRGVPA